MKSIKHLFTTLLLLCATMATAHDFNVNGIYYDITDATNRTVEVTYRGTFGQYSNEYTGDVVIPESVTYRRRTYSVTSIGGYAFNDCSGLTSIVIPNSVTNIGEGAFSGCTGLTSITIPNSVTSIGYWAFSDCSGLTSIVIPNSVTNIGRSAFSGCTGLTSITIPNSVTSIGNYAFEDCSGLKTVINFSNLTFSKGSSSNGDVAYYADKVYNAPIGSIEGDYVFGKPNGVNTLVGYFGNETELSLPTDYNGENYVIGSSAFYGCSGLTSVVIGNSVTSIGDFAFQNCTGLKSVVIGNSVTSIGRSAFGSCFGLTSVHISDLAAWCNIDFDSSYANPLFHAKNLYLNGELLTELVIPDGITEIKDYAFYKCTNLTSITIHNGVKTIGESAFSGCSNVETIYISNNIESIGDEAFAECNNILEIKIGSKKVITASENIFSTDVYNNACLYVPTCRKDFYAKTSPWSNFIISEIDFTDKTSF